MSRHLPALTLLSFFKRHNSGSIDGPVSIPSSFKLVFWTVTALTILSFLGIVLLAFFGDKAVTEAHIGIFQQRLSQACSFGWQAGIGAILGLIGGKLTS